MENIKSKRFINALIMIIAIFLPLLFIQFTLNNDTYWIIKTGEYICNNGIPTKDFLTIHTDMDLVVQQWLSDVIYYKAYSLLGVCGPMLIVYAMYFVFQFLAHKLCSIISNRKFVIWFDMFFINVAVAKLFFVTRPQIFTYCIMLAELIFLEKYVKTGKVKNLIALPFLSMLCVNLHASMWTMLFIIMLPYFANALPIKFKGKSIKCCKLLPLVITAIVMVVFGLITPYGFKGLSFIFTTSIGNKVNSSISELKPITVTFNYTNVFLLAFIAMLLCLYMFNKKGKTNLRYVLLTIGTALMALMYKKLFAYFIIASYPVALAFVENINFKSFMTFSNKKRKSNKRILIVATEFVLILLVGLCGFTVYDFAKDVANSIDNNGGTVHTANLDDALDAIEADSKSTGTDIVLYNGFNDGGYIEFKGYKAYIDPRADSFVEEANHDYDYLNEYFDFSGGDVYYQDIVDKYGFTYLIVEKKTDKPLYISLLNDDNYQLIFDLDDEETKESIHVFKYTK